jgi:hypothetical protein
MGVSHLRSGFQTFVWLAKNKKCHHKPSLWVLDKANTFYNYQRWGLEDNFKKGLHATGNPALPTLINHKHFDTE